MEINILAGCLSMYLWGIAGGIFAFTILKDAKWYWKIVGVILSLPVGLWQNADIICK